MKPRFEEDKPWFFGWTPYEYHDTLSAESKKKIKLENISLTNLDEFQALANSCYNTRIVNDQFLSVLSEILNYPYDGRVYESCLEILSLSVVYCKPLSEIMRIRGIEEVAEVMNTYGLETKIHTEGMYVGYCKGIIDAMAECEEFFKKGKLTFHERSLINGMLFGFPLGDVFGFCLGSSDDQFFPGLVHVPYSKWWSDEWKEKVGFDGLEHLLNIYHTKSPLHLGYNERSIKNGTITVVDNYTIKIHDSAYVKYGKHS